MASHIDQLEAALQRIKYLEASLENMEPAHTLNALINRMCDDIDHSEFPFVADQDRNVIVFSTTTNQFLLQLEWLLTHTKAEASCDTCVALKREPHSDGSTCEGRVCDCSCGAHCGEASERVAERVNLASAHNNK